MQALNWTFTLAAISRPTGAIADWLTVAVVLVVFTLGTPIVGRAVERALSKPGRPERQRSLAEPARRFVATLLITAALVVCIGILSPSSLKPFPTKLVEFLPRLLIAILLLLVGSTVATLAAGVVGVAAAKSLGRPQPAIARATRGAVLAVVSLLAVGQLGVNTRVLDTLTTATVFGLVGTVSLLTVLGGRQVASNLAAGRYVRRIMAPGDEVDCDSGRGVVRAVHGATVELDAPDGWTLHVPTNALISNTLRVRKAPGSSVQGEATESASPATQP